MKKYLFTIALAFFAATQLQAFQDNTTLLVEPGHEVVDLASYTYSLITEDHSIGIEEVQKGIGFKRRTEKVHLKYKSDSVAWIRFTLLNKNPEDLRYILEVSNATINDIQLYKPDTSSGEYTMIQTGDVYDFDNRELDTRDFSFILTLPYDKPQTFYLRIDPQLDAVGVPLKLWNSSEFMVKSVHERYLLGLYYGSMLFIIIFHLFLYYKLRDNSLIWYMLYIIGVTGFQLGQDGFISKYLLPDLPWLANRLVITFVYLSSVALIRFLQIYVNTKETIPRYHKVLRVMYIIGLVMVASTFLPNSLFVEAIRLANFWAPGCTLLVIIGAVLAFKNEPVLSRYFIVAFLFLIVGISLAALKSFGFETELSEHGFKIGASGEAIILAFALAVRFKMIDEKTQELALTHLRNLNELKDEYNAQLEDTVQERTAQLEKSNNDIKDSIRYAKRIQTSLLPEEGVLNKAFKDSFVYYRPKDIVSGDFYWHQQVNGQMIVAAVDCTGHGVPGAFMSMLGSTLLKEIVITRGITSPEEILKLLNEGVRSALKQNDPSGLSKDGMDLSLISYAAKEGILEFAGAKRPLFQIRDGEIHIHKGDKKSIGGNSKLSGQPYEGHKIEVKEGDAFYLFSDGYPDQFGGPDNRKFMIKRFKELVISISSEKMERQYQLLDEAMLDWRGSQKQIDDVLVIGIRI